MMDGHTDAMAWIATEHAFFRVLFCFQKTKISKYAFGELNGNTEMISELLFKLENKNKMMFPVSKFYFKKRENMRNGRIAPSAAFITSLSATK